MEFKDRVKLDKNCLDDNAIEHPLLYEEWSKKWALAVFERDKIKERISVVTAEAAKEIRSEPKNFGWDSDKAPTEAFINSQIPLHPKVREVQEEVIQAQYEVNLYASAKETLQQRNEDLKILAQLYSGAYFSAKSNPELKEQAREKTSDAQREGLTSPRLKRKV